MTDKIHPTILKELIDLGDRLTEDRLREIVIAEIESNEMDGVAQAYALEEADGDEKKARAYYTKHRVRRIRDLITQESILAEEERAEEEERAKQKQAEEEKIARKRQAEIAKRHAENTEEGIRAAEERAEAENIEESKKALKQFFYLSLIVAGILVLLAAFG